MEDVRHKGGFCTYLADEDLPFCYTLPSACPDGNRSAYYTQGSGTGLLEYSYAACVGSNATRPMSTATVATIIEATETTSTVEMTVNITTSKTATIMTTTTTTTTTTTAAAAKATTAAAGAVVTMAAAAETATEAGADAGAGAGKTTTATLTPLVRSEDDSVDFVDDDSESGEANADSAESKSPEAGARLSKGAVAGLAVGLVVLFAALFVGATWCVGRNEERAEQVKKDVWRFGRFSSKK